MATQEERDCRFVQYNEQNTVKRNRTLVVDLISVYYKLMLLN